MLEKLFNQKKFMKLCMNNLLEKKSYLMYNKYLSDLKIDVKKGWYYDS